MTDHDATIVRLRSERGTFREHLLAAREAWERTKGERDAARTALAECERERDAALLSAAAHAADALRLREALEGLAGDSDPPATESEFYARWGNDDFGLTIAVARAAWGAARAALGPRCPEKDASGKCKVCGGNGSVVRVETWDEARTAMYAGWGAGEVVNCPSCRGEGGEGVRGLREWLLDIAANVAMATKAMDSRHDREMRWTAQVDETLRRLALPRPSLAPLECLCEAVRDECAERWHDGGLFASAMVQHARCAGDCGWDQYGDHLHWHIHLVLDARVKEMPPTDILARLREGR